MREATAYGLAALRGEERNVRHSKPGTRNQVLNEAAFNLGTLVPRHLPQLLAVRVLTDAAVITTANAKGTDPLSEEEIAATIDSGLRSGMATPRLVTDGYGDRDDAIEDLGRARTAWDNTPMGGWEGRRCKQVMPGIFAIAYQMGGPRNIPLPITRLSIEAGTPNRNLISKALNDLIDLGWLTRTSLGGPGHATRYSLHIPAYQASRSKDPSTLQPPGSWERPDPAMTGHDAGRVRSLGPSALRVYLWLALEPGTWFPQAHVARALGVHPGTVGRYVKPHRPLVTLGLVDRNDKGRIRATGPADLASLDHTAHHTGTLGARDRDRARLTRYFQAEGFLDQYWRWLDPRDGTPRNTAVWLLPERPHARLDPPPSRSRFVQGFEHMRRECT